MKSLIVTFGLMMILLLASFSTSNAQADKVYQNDSLKSGHTTNTFTINARHNYNTFQVDSLAATDSIRVFHLSESGKEYPVALRDLTTYTDLSGNLITNLTGKREFLVLHPNLYKLKIYLMNTSPSKTFKINRRGNNLK